MTMWLLILVLSCVTYGVTGQAQPWWNTAVYYRILVDSFKDSDANGLGDLKGATKQISYVRALGADAVILSPLSARSSDCSKPGTKDFAEIDQRYGNTEHFNSLLEKAKKLELKVVVTLNIKTISAASEWFTSSAKKLNGFDDRILWKDGKADEPPPPERGVDTWVWHEERGAYWGSSNNEALLNLCSDGVAAALSEAQCAWLRKGVGGVLLNPDFPKDQSCGEQILKKLAAEAMRCARSANLETPVILVETSLNAEESASYYADGSVGANSILSKALTLPTRSAPKLAVEFHAALLQAPQDMVPTWLTSSQNESRIATRHGSEMIDAINLLALILPGAAVIQQGDELGTADTILEWISSDTCWPIQPVPSAAPFPWDDTTNAGFTSGQPWIPLAPNYRYANAKTEYANDFSHVGVVRVAAAMRKSPALGPHTEIKRLGDAIAVLRWGGQGSLLVLSNVAKDQTEVQLYRLPGLPSEVTVAASSTGSSLSTGSHVAVDKTLKLAPGETVLLAGGPRHCGGPGPVDKIANKLSEGWQKLNKYFSNI